MLPVDYKSYSFETHQIAKDNIDPDALHVLEKLRAHGHVAYLVGGGVRDLLLGYKPKDFDISTSAKPEEIKQLFRSCILIGRRFRLAHVRFGNKIFEVSTFRSGNTETDSLILRDNTWGTPEEDVLRRDFTINGLFYDAATEEVIDYVGGYPDLQQHLLRTIGQPFSRFKQDPVRMLRLLKFQARFGFHTDPAAHTALIECRQEITKSAPARILEEILKMLESGSSEPFFRLLAEQGFLDLLAPALGEWMQSPLREEILSYLTEIDSLVRTQETPLPDRAVLLSSFVFPIFEKRMQVRYINRGRLPHLGEIAAEANHQINELFLPFLNLTKRLRGCLISILTSQYRFTPLEAKKPGKIRIPDEEDFPLALAFFKLRAALHPALQPTWLQWVNALGPQEPARTRKRRRS